MCKCACDTTYIVQVVCQKKKGHPVLFSFFENIIVLCLAFVILIFKVAIIGIFKLVVFVF